jgi:uncharacterized protein
MLFAIVIILILMPSSVFAVDFNCAAKGLTQTEQSICKYTDLDRLDSILSSIYKEFKLADKENSRTSQLAWIKKRNMCNVDVHCIEKSYRERIYEISRILNYNNPDQISDPKLFATLDYIKDSSPGRETSCEEFPDINFDKKSEFLCLPDCGGPACSSYFFVTNANSYKYHPELEMGSYNNLRVVAVDEISDSEIDSVPIIGGNTYNNWRILKNTYQHQCQFSEEYLFYSNGKYISRTVIEKNTSPIELPSYCGEESK